MKRHARACALLIVLASGCGPVLIWHGRSPDRARRVRIVEAEGRQKLMVDGQPRGAFDAVGFTHLRWSTRGPVVPVRVGDQWHLSSPSELGPGHSAIGEVAVMGERVAYAALSDEGWRVIAGGVPGPAFESLRAESLTFGPEARRLVYVGRDAGGAHAVIDDEVGPAFARIGPLVFGGKGTLVGYAGVDGGGAAVVIHGREVLRADAVAELVLADVAPRWAAIAVRDGERAVVHEGASYPAPSARGLRISADGAHLAWVATRGERVEVWRDGRRVASHLAVDEMRFVGRSGALAYVAREEDGVHVVHEGELGPRVSSVEALVVSDAGHVGYIARRGIGYAVVIDGRVRYRGEWGGGLTLAARSARFAFLIREAGRRFLVTPDARIELARPFVDTLVLDPEGVHWAIAVADPRTRRIDVLVDGEPVAPLDVDEVSAARMQGRDPIRIVRRIVAGELARRIERRVGLSSPP